MDSQQFKRAAYAAIDEIVEYYETVQDRRVASNVKPGYLGKLLPDSPPKYGEQWEDIQNDIESKIMPGITHWQSPKFMAFFPASSTYPSMLGELYSAALGVPAFNWECSPAMTELETIVLDWLAKLLHLPSCYLSSSDGGGVINTSASDSVATVMVAARDRYLNDSTSHLQGEEKEMAISHLRGRLVALGSEMSHSCTQKAAIIAGTKYLSVPVRSEDHFGMTGHGLQQTLEQCQGGLEPFFLTVTLGTTTTCAVDNFEQIAQVLERYPKIWTHVDAAYAGSALICEEYQHLTEHFALFDSFTTNMSKWLLVNIDASCLFIKSRRTLTSALSITPSYLRNPFSDSGAVIDYRDWGFGLTRRFRALKIWFVMRTYGTTGLKSHIRSQIQLGHLFNSLILSRPNLFRIVSGPAFALVTMAVVPSPDGCANVVTREVLDAIRREDIYLLGVNVQDTYAIRVCCAISHTDEKYMWRAFGILVRVTEEVLRRQEQRLIVPGTASVGAVEEVKCRL